MRAKEIVRLVRIHSGFIVYVSVFLMALSAGCFAQAQTTVASQNAEPPQTSGADVTTKVSNGAAVFSAKPRLGSPIHIVPFRDPGAVTTKLNSFPVGAHVDYFGGPVISNVHIVLVLYGAGSYLPNIAGTAAPTMANFFTDITQSTFFDMLSEYSTVGVTAADGTAGTNQTIGHGFYDGQFTITPNPANDGATITDNQIQTELLSQVTAGNLPAPFIDAQGNNNTLYMIFFPPGKTINDGTSNSCVRGGFCAYHNSTTSTFSTHRLFYGVLPDLQPPSGCSTGCGGGTTFDQATNVTSHELSEAVTDADVGPATTFARPLAWIDQFNGEIGDICVAQEANVVANGTNYTVQQEFSNFQNTCASSPPNFVFVFTPTSLNAGVEFNGTVNLQTGASSFNGVYTGTVHFTSSDPNAVLPPDYTYNVADSASHPFPFTLNSSGNQTITVTDTQRVGVTGSATFSVSIPAAFRFQIVNPPSAKPGVPIFVSVTALDVNFAIATGYNRTVHFTSTDPAAVLPPDTALVNGTGVFSVTFNTPSNGFQTLTITDAGAGQPFAQANLFVLAQGPQSTSTTLSAGATSTTFGQPTTFSATVTGGTSPFLGTPVIFTSDGQQVASGNVDSTGHATASAILIGGAHTMFAEFVGDSFHDLSSSAPLAVTINPAPTTTVVTSGTNPSVFLQGDTFTINLASPAQAAIPGLLPGAGNIIVFDGPTAIAVLPPLAPGTQESFVAQSLSPGSHSITAQYSGNASFATSTSAPLVQVVNPAPPADYQISVNQASATLLAGQSATFGISIASISKFVGSVHFTCGNLPALAKCTFGSTNFVVFPNQTSFISLVVSTVGPHAMLTGPSRRRNFNAALWSLSTFAFGLVVAGRRRKRFVQFAGRFISGLLLVVVISCGGGGSTPPPVTTTVAPVTPAGTTSIVVTATGIATAGAGPATPTQQLTLTLTVQP